MPGIFGYVKKSDNSDISLLEMSKELTHENWYESFLFSHGKLDAGAISTAPYFKKGNNFSESSEYILVVEGNTIQFRNYNIHKTEGFAEILLDEYSRKKESLIKGLKGSFNVLIYDKLSNELKLINDRFGFSYLYYYDDPDLFSFSPEYKAFLKHKNFNKELDYRSISLFLSSGVVLGNDTYFKNVKLLPPSSILTFDGRDISITQYWKPEFNALGNKNEDYFIDAALELYKESIRQKVPLNNSKRLIQPLSGGLDSRLIFGIAGDKYCNLELYTYGNTKCSEYKLAKAIFNTNANKFTHNLITLTPDMIYENAYKAVWLNEGQVDFSSSICRSIANIMGPGKETFLNGIIGAHLSLGCQNFFGIEEIKPITEKNEIERRLYSILGLNAGHRFFNLYLKPEYITPFIHRGKEAVIENYKPYETGGLFCDQKDLFINYNLGRRMMGNIDLFKFFFHDVHPFIDYGLFDLYLSVPAELKIGHYLYQQLFKKHFPDLAAIPWTNTGRNLYVKDPRKRYRFKNDLKQKIIYYTGRLSRGRISIKDNNSYIHNSIWLRKNPHFNRFVKDNIQDIDALEIPFFIRKKVLKMMELHDLGKDYFFTLLARITTFIIWYKLFVLNSPDGK